MIRNNFLYVFLMVIVIAACSDSTESAISVDEAIQRTQTYSTEFIDFSRGYYSYKQCRINKTCEKTTPYYINGKIIFKNYNPPSDEFYLEKRNNIYYIYYKNITVENVEIGWAKAKLLENHGNLFLEIDKVYQVMGAFNPIGGGDELENIQSAHAREGFYYLDDHYDKYSFNQPQKITFLKQQDGTLLLDCKSYLKYLDPENNFSGIFYGVCHDGIKVYFKTI